MFKQYFIESKNIEKELTALIKKNNAAVIIDSVGIEIFVDEVAGGWAYGIDQFDKDVEINLRKVGKEYRIQEGTGSGDIAQGSARLGKLRKQCKAGKGSYESGEEDECTNESAVGQRGRTDAKSALAHLTPALKKQFRKLLKDVGGKTVMRYLLADAPLQEGKVFCRDVKSTLEMFTPPSKRMKAAIDEVLDLIDTDC